jgi:hypothetical protein
MWEIKLDVFGDYPHLTKEPTESAERVKKWSFSACSALSVVKNRWTPRTTVDL